MRRAPWYLPIALLSVVAVACQPAAAPAPTAAPKADAKPADKPADKPGAAPTSAPAAKPAESKPGAAGEVRLGIILPLTGNFASLGQQYHWATQTAVEVVNEDIDIQVPLGKGAGLPGLGGAKLNMIVRDDQSRGELARTIAEQLITVDKVHWIDGDGTSGNTALLQPVAEQRGIPMSCHACASPSLTEKGMKWYFRTGPNDKLMIGNIFTFMKEWPERGGPAGLKSMAVFSCDNLFCQDGRKVALELAPAAGVQVVADITTKTGATTFASEVQQLQASNADVLFIVQYPPESQVIQADMKRAGYMPKLIMTNNGQYSDQTWLDAQKKTNGGVGWMGRDPTSVDLAKKNPNWQKVNDIYKKYSNGLDMGELAMRHFTGIIWIADTMNRAASTEPGALQKAARETNTPPDQLIIDYKGIKFDENGQNTLATGVITQIGWDGDKHTVWPWDSAKEANHQVIFPMPSWEERDSKPKPAS